MSKIHKISAMDSEFEKSVERVVASGRSFKNGLKKISVLTFLNDTGTWSLYYHVQCRFPETSSGTTLPNEGKSFHSDEWEEAVAYYNEL